MKNADGALWVTDFFDGITDEGTAAYESWIKHVLPECRHDAYNKEKELLEESLLLEDPADSDKYPIHRLLLNTVKKIKISEAAVERAFSRHKLVHNRLRANLQESTMDNHLFIRYNFETILDDAQREVIVLEMESK